MSDREVPGDAHIRFDPQSGKLLLVDRDGKPVSEGQRKTYIQRMTRDELQALVEALFELPPLDRRA